MATILEEALDAYGSAKFHLGACRGGDEARAQIKVLRAHVLRLANLVPRSRRVERIAAQILAARFTAAGHGGIWGEEDVKVAYHAANALIDYIDKAEAP